jgi:DNA-directed RNA polymerase subunit RPC12/RpoP
MALRIEGGVIEMAEQRTFRCSDCEHEWQLPFGTGRPSECPQCQSKIFRRAEEERGRSGKGRGGPANQVAAVAGGEVEAAAKSGRGRKRQRRRRGVSP